MSQDTSLATTDRIKLQDFAREAAALLGFSLALAVTAGVIKTPMGVPGHSAVLWIPVLVLAGCRRLPGFAVATAVCGGAMAAGLGGFRAMEFAGVLASAAVIEAFGLGRSDRPRGLLILAAAALGHVAKLLTKILALLVAGMPLNRAGLPLVPTLALYASFGIIGGLIGWSILRGWNRLRGSKSETTDQELSP